MRVLNPKFRAVLCCAILFVLSTAAARADDMAFMGTINGGFGVVDLNTGVFTLDGNSGQTLAGMAVESATLYGSSYHTATGTLYTINPVNGAVTAVGTSTVDIDDFGSTTSGLYAVGTDGNLYSINASTGAATKIGATGFGTSIPFGSWRSLSTNSSTLYFANGTSLYTMSTSTGASTLIGSTGGPEEGALLFEDGILYGGENSPSYGINTLNVSTGTATFESSVSGTSSAFFALAPNPLPSSTVPEPSSLTLFGSELVGLAGLAATFKRRLRKWLK
jgi:PEP-CTERM motif